MRHHRGCRAQFAAIRHRNRAAARAGGYRLYGRGRYEMSKDELAGWRQAERDERGQSR